MSTGTKPATVVGPSIDLGNYLSELEGGRVEPVLPSRFDAKRVEGLGCNDAYDNDKGDSPNVPAD